MCSDPICGTDLEWFTATGNCGGCGDDADKCHPGWPCGEVPGFEHEVCDLCPTRVATGEIESLGTRP